MQESALNTYLIEIGVPESEVERLVNSAVAWRTTPGGRPLIDRRRQSRLTRNVQIVAQYLVEKCNVSLGESGVAAIFMRTPELMLCKPSNNDRWDRRAVELAAFLLNNGHCNVPETYSDNPELGVWVKRQRVARAAGQLSAERLKILERMGFEFGDLAQVTEEWESRFDQLVDWVLWHGESGESFCWDLINWGRKGGITARELALWISLQREFLRRQLLPAEAVQRFEAIAPGWISKERSSEETEWMAWLGRLVYVIERRRLAIRRPPNGRGNPFSARKIASGAQADSATANQTNDDTLTRNSALKSQVFKVVASRRDAASSAEISEDPGLRYWISRQRWLWRKSRLDPERVKMLQLAGIDMDIYPSTVWRDSAHLAASFLHNFNIANEVEIGEERLAQYNDYQGSNKLKVLRWVETQRALYLENRLSPGQLRYLTFLGISWILSDKVFKLDTATWLHQWKVLNAKLKDGSIDFEVHEWLSHQIGLLRLGLLSESRVEKLQLLQTSFDLGRPTQEQQQWNKRLSQLLAHSAELGHADVDSTNECFPGLASWVTKCKLQIKEGSMPASRVAQLKALGTIK